MYLFQHVHLHRWEHTGEPGSGAVSKVRLHLLQRRLLNRCLTSDVNPNLFTETGLAAPDNGRQWEGGGGSPLLLGPADRGDWEMPSRERRALSQTEAYPPPRPRPECQATTQALRLQEANDRTVARGQPPPTLPPPCGAKARLSLPLVLGREGEDAGKS